ncbi:MAG TPA: DNA-processing protein DprA [Steroidobacteraceae bacterium]|nr:DNA-processing protein DprA [Steroidobacteraceae bacterium]
MTNELLTALERERPLSALAELGAYEALWADERTSFASLARLFRAYPGARPSDLVTPRTAREHGAQALALAAAAGVGDFEVCVHGMASYAARLRDAACPLELIYYQGRWPLLDGRCVALVGTRKPSAAGLRCATAAGRLLALAGFTILSGLARGIDTAVHRAVLAAGGATAAVLGTALTASYPPENAALQRRLAREQLLVSQVPLIRYARQGSERNRAFFRARNATLAALAEALVVVEAGDRSGALIAARHACEQRRKVLLLPPCLDDRTLRWPAALLRRGARALAHLEDLESALAA